MAGMFIGGILITILIAALVLVCRKYDVASKVSLSSMLPSKGSVSGWKSKLKNPDMPSIDMEENLDEETNTDDDDAINTTTFNVDFNNKGQASV